MDINRYFLAIPGKTKMIEIGWHDYEDDRSLQKTIHIPINEDPETGATGFLMEYVPGMYDFEWAHEVWRIEVGPVSEGPGPGDGSDAPFEITMFRGSEDEAKAKSEELCKYWRDHFGGFHPDIGHFDVGAGITNVS